MKRLILALLVCFAPTLAHAWGADGHKITATIAEQHLTPEAREAVAELLGEQSMADVSIWADEIKWRRPETRPWHYLNVPDGADQVTFELCVEQGDVLATIRDQAAVLQSPESTQIQRAEALRFLIHMVGDIHQPLHVSRAHDKGGNDIKVEFQGSKTNLHSLWDSGMLRATRVKWPDYAERLNDDITPEQVEAWSELDPPAWATESYILAMRDAYPIPRSMVIEDDPAYVDRGLNIIDERLAMGGVRLAALLNSIFGGEATASAEVPACCVGLSRAGLLPTVTP